MIHGIICTHLQFEKEHVGYVEICFTRFRRYARAVAFTPYLPDRVTYFITPETLINIVGEANTPAQACRIIWRAQPADGLRRPQ